MGLGVELMEIAREVLDTLSRRGWTKSTIIFVAEQDLLCRIDEQYHCLLQMYIRGYVDAAFCGR